MARTQNEKLIKAINKAVGDLFAIQHRLEDACRQNLTGSDKRRFKADMEHIIGEALKGMVMLEHEYTKED